MRFLLARGRVLSDLILSGLVIVLFATLTIDVLWGVFSRYALGAQTRWTDELATTLMVWVSLLGAALVYGLDDLKRETYARHFLQRAVLVVLARPH